jgi:hypothetical protein
MPDIKGGLRTTISGVGSKFPSREPGTRVGLQVNVFGLKKLSNAITGDMLADILKEAIQPAYQQALAEWPVLTGASRDSIDIEVTEVGGKFARVALQAGGEKLIYDERNRSGKDYAPFIEFNGTLTTPPGTLIHAMHSTESEMKQIIKSKVSEFLRDILQ